MESRKVKTVDNLAVVRMVKHAADAAKPAAAGPGAPHAPPAPPAGSAIGSHVVKTVQPTRWVIRCFDCGYEFKLSGKTADTYCPKCRTSIDLSDHVIDKSWSRDLKTAGTIQIKPAGVIQGAVIMGGTIIVEGGVEEGATLEASQKLSLRATAQVHEGQFKARDLHIGAGFSLKMARKALFHNVEVEGTLEADLESSGLVHIKASGDMRGVVRTERLIVEEGGGLTARLFVWPKGAEPMELA